MKSHEFSFNATAKAVYIKIHEGKIARTKEIAQEVFLDVDSTGKVLGVELLNPGAVVISEISRRYRIPFLKKIAPDIERIYKKLQLA